MRSKSLLIEIKFKEKDNLNYLALALGQESHILFLLYYILVGFLQI